MENGKATAIRNYIANHEQEFGMKRDIVIGLRNNPDLIRDVGYREASLDSALTLYKVAMFGLGVPPENISRNAEEARVNILKRNGKLEFIQKVASAFETVERLASVQKICPEPVQLANGEPLALGDSAIPQFAETGQLLAETQVNQV